MKLPAGFGDLDFTDWALGLVSAFVTGGASAVMSGVVVSVKDPNHYALGTLNFFEIVGSVFLMSGVMNMFAFLRTKPIPELKKVEKTVEASQLTGGPTLTVTTVKETTIEPKDPASK